MIMLNILLLVNLINLLRQHLIQNENKHSIRIIVWNSIRNKYTEFSEAFNPLQAKMFFKNYKAFFAFCGAILGMSNIFL